MLLGTNKGPHERKWEAHPEAPGGKLAPRYTVENFRMSQKPVAVSNAAAMADVGR